MNSIVAPTNPGANLLEPVAPSFDQICSALRSDADNTIAAFGTLKLGSHFQPIFSLAHQRVIGFEALLRATDHEGRARAPLEVFGAVHNRADTILLDRLCRAVHLHNFARHNVEPAWLFLNVNPQVVVEGKRYGAFFREQLERVNFPPHRVVVEILESALADQSLLTEAVEYYRDLGCLIAIDDFGAGHSNFDRICGLRPDIVKFDRLLVTQAAANRNIRAIMPGMVSLLHEAGSLVVMEGVESEFEAMIAMDSDADFVQGFYFARPNRVPVGINGQAPAFGSLFDQFRRVNAIDRASYRSEIAPYINGIGYASVMLKSGRPLESACASFLELPRAQFCFLLDADGLQIGSNVYAPHLQVTPPDPRYAPLNDARRANWSRRHYFRRAVAQPEKVHVTRPYLSVTRATPCLTTSIAFQHDGRLQILCGDVSWDDKCGATLDRTIETQR